MSVVMLGVPACGKTVLLSAMVLKFQEKILAKNTAAIHFKQNANILKQGMWPPPTNKNVAAQPMEWALKSRSEKIFSLSTADVAGEAWEEFINQSIDQGVSLEAMQQDEKLQPIIKMFQDVDAVCLLLDLTRTDQTRQKMFVEAVAAFLLFKIKRKNCPVAFVVTKLNTLPSDWESQLGENYIRSIKNFAGNYTVIETDAVAETITDPENQAQPAPDFSSVGLDKLFDWIDDVKIQKAKSKRLKFVCMVVWLLILALLASLLAYRFIPRGLVFLVIFVILGAVIAGIAYSLRGKWLPSKNNNKGMLK